MEALDSDEVRRPSGRAVIGSLDQEHLAARDSKSVEDQAHGDDVCTR